MAGLLEAVGTGLIFLVLIDVFLTVLYPRSGKGWLSIPIKRCVWMGFRLVAAAPIWQQSYQRGRILSFCGPVLLVTVVLVWVLLLLYGFAFIAWAGLGSAIKATQEPTPTDFIAALYYSGYSLTTLGFGDLVPKTDAYRLLAVLESALGFSVFTLTITYLLAVYNALTQRNVFALSLHHATARTANAAELIARLGVGGDFNHSRQDIAQISANALLLLESHHAYPVLHYFRFQETYYALARIALLTMDTATLIQSALNQETYRSLIRSTAVTELGDGGQHLLVELSSSFLPARYQKNLPSKSQKRKGQPEALLRLCYYRAVERLRQEGIDVAPDLEAGADFYIALRRNWEPYIMAIADYMAFEWDEIAISE